MRKLLLLFLLCAGAASAQTAWFADTTGKNYTTFSASLASPSQNPVVCGLQWGSSATAKITIADDAGTSAAAATSFWDSSNRQGIAAYYLTKGGGTRFTATSSVVVNYVSMLCAPVASSGIDLQASAAGASLRLAAPAADTVVAFIVEDQVGTGDNFTPGMKFTMLKNAGVNGFAAEIGSGDPLFNVAPSGNSTIIAAVALAPPAPTTFAYQLQGGPKVTFLVPSLNGIPTCGPNDGVCSIAIQVTLPDGTTVTGTVGSIALVKIATLPTPQTQIIPIVTVGP